MLRQVKEALVMLRICDPDGSLSLSSIVLMAAVGKFIFTPTLDTETLLALLGALASYQGKKIINQRASGSETSEQLAELGTKVQALEVGVTTALNRTQPVRR